MAEKDGERHQEQPPLPTSAFQAVLRVIVVPFIVTALCPKLEIGVWGARWSWSKGAAGEEVFRVSGQLMRILCNYKFNNCENMNNY